MYSDSDEQNHGSVISTHSLQLEAHALSYSCLGDSKYCIILNPLALRMQQHNWKRTNEA